MLLKKQEKGDITKVMYSSSNICASTYDKSLNELTIIFNNGGQYLYSNVSSTDYTRFELADSQGAVFNSHIKTHPFTKLDKINVSLIMEEVKTLKDADEQIILDATVKAMVDKLRAVVTYYDTATSVETRLLDNAKAGIATYEALIQPKLDKVNG